MKTATVLAALALASPFLLSPALAQAIGEKWPVIDQDELAAMQEDSVPGFALFTQAQSHFEQGDYVAAADEFAGARKFLPERALPARRQCEAQIALGRRTDAVESCGSAVRSNGSAMDCRAMVAALMMGPSAPSSEDLSYAHLLAEKAVGFTPEEHWGYAARCDIALATGDDPALQSCVSRMTELAPNHPDTARYASRQSTLARNRTWLGTLLWSIFGLTVFITGIRSILRAVGARGARNKTMVVTVALLCLTTKITFAQSGLTSPSSQLPQNAAPGDETPPQVNDALDPPDLSKAADAMEYGAMLLDLGGRAEAAKKQGNFADAAKFFSSITTGEHALVIAGKLRSASAAAYRGACDAYRHLGKRSDALEACRNAVTSEGSEISDFANLVHLILEAPDPLPAEELEQARQALLHLTSVSPLDPTAPHLQCEVALRVNDQVSLDACSARLEKLAPSDPKTLTFLWAAAMKKADFAAAETFIQRARESGTDAKTLRGMEEATLQARPGWRRGLIGNLWPLILALAACGFGGGLWRLKMRPRVSSAPSVNDCPQSSLQCHPSNKS